MHQIPHPHAEGFGNPQERMKTNPLLSPFYFSNINWVQVSLFRQFLLTHADLITVFPNGIPKNFKVLSCACHSLPRKQGGLRLRTPNMGLFFPLTIPLENLGLPRLWE
jgi:hypothetical protein